MSAPALDYPAAVAELRRRGRFGVSLGLERIAAILDALGHPERALQGALVAGTNGKGSVIALARSALTGAGVRVGTMPKPHLVAYRERIAVDGAPVSPDRFAEAIAAVLPAVDAVSRRLGPPTEFEVLTAAAFAELARAQVAMALIEVGLGGRLDATNVLDPGVAAVTTVQHDHERHLGRTLAAIGAEKAAIIKPGNLAVTGASGNGLAPVLDRCAALGVPLRRTGRGQPYRAELLDSGWDGLTIRLVTPHGELDALRVGLLGRHQAANAAVAVALLDALAENAVRHGAPWALTEESLRAGFAAARWPGRLELLRSTPLGDVLLDGAHNPAGARALATALGDLGLRGAPLVFGATRGKRVTAVLRALAPLAPRPVFTTFPGGPAIAATDLRRAWQRVAGSGAEVAATPRGAMTRAAQLRRGGEPVVVAGSLYLVGAVRGMLTGQEEDE
jgi:dihydrofolate synthase/folylpolyglutamate synthase